MPRVTQNFTGQPLVNCLCIRAFQLFIIANRNCFALQHNFQSGTLQKVSKVSKPQSRCFRKTLILFLDLFSQQFMKCRLLKSHVNAENFNHILCCKKARANVCVGSNDCIFCLSCTNGRISHIQPNNRKRLAKHSGNE